MLNQILARQWRDHRLRLSSFQLIAVDTAAALSLDRCETHCSWFVTLGTHETSYEVTLSEGNGHNRT